MKGIYLVTTVVLTLGLLGCAVPMVTPSQDFVTAPPAEEVPIELTEAPPPERLQVEMQEGLAWDFSTLPIEPYRWELLYVAFRVKNPTGETVIVKKITMEVGGQSEEVPVNIEVPPDSEWHTHQIATTGIRGLPPGECNLTVSLWSLVCSQSETIGLPAPDEEGR